MSNINYFKAGIIFKERTKYMKKKHCELFSHYLRLILLQVQSHTSFESKHTIAKKTKKKTSKTGNSQERKE